MKTFIEESATDFARQINQCAENISDQITTLSLDADEVANFKTTSNFVQIIFDDQNNIQTYAHAFSEYKRELHKGPSRSLMGQIPKAPALHLVPPTISLGNARAQFADLIQHCVSSPKFTRDIGIILGFMKPDSSEKETVVVPNLTVKITTGGHPILHATKGIFQGYEVWKDISDGKGYCKLDTSMYADYTDHTELPVFGVGKTWKYKVIYLLKGAHHGTWSAEVTIGVFGQI
ncbi:MAG: hypothetical protein WCP65_01385 [Bacteroidota bacterium]